MFTCSIEDEEVIEEQSVCEDGFQVYHSSAYKKKMKRLEKLGNEQKSMRQSLDSRITNLEKSISESLTLECTKIREEMTLEFSRITNEITALKTRFNDIELKFTDYDK